MIVRLRKLTLLTALALSLNPLLPASALGFMEALDGLRVHVTTWDYDGGWRRLEPEGSGHTFGGGDGAAGDPLWMDAVEVKVTPRDRAE